jgi:hypothetical protein
MALLSNSKTLFIDDNGVMTFSGGNYAFNFTSNKNFIQVEQEDGQTTNLRAGQFDKVEKLVIGQDTNVTLDFSKLGDVDIDFQANGGVNLTGISFTGADAALESKFEPKQNLDSIIVELLSERGVEGAIDALTINGGKGDAFKAVWDYLDDNYSTYGNYYNETVNEAFIRLGLKYVEYLRKGGEPLDDVIGKYAADGSDEGTNPDRVQSIHDNLLGNFNKTDFDSRFPVGTELRAELWAEIVEAEATNLYDRPLYNGYEWQTAPTAWDVQHEYLLVV